MLTHHSGLRCHLVLHDGMALTSEELLRLLDLGLERLVREEELLLLRDGQVDEHTSDLRGLLGADELENEVVDALADLLLEVGVVLDASRDEALGLLLVPLLGSGRYHWCGSERPETLRNHTLRAGVHAPRATFVEVVLTFLFVRVLNLVLRGQLYALTKFCLRHEAANTVICVTALRIELGYDVNVSR